MFYILKYKLIVLYICIVIETLIKMKLTDKLESCLLKCLVAAFILLIFTFKELNFSYFAYKLSCTYTCVKKIEQNSIISF